MRVVFLGNCADYSLRFLEALVARTERRDDPVELVAVVCPQRFPSRKAALTFSAKRRVGHALQRLPAPLRRRAALRGGPWTRVQQLASSVDAPVFWPHNVGDAEVCARVVALKPDVAIVAGLNQILRERLLAAFPPVFNFHPSLLPEYRGGLPEFWMLDAGAREGGVTVHRIERGVDTGPIVAQRRFAIEPWLDAEGLIARCSAVGAELMSAFLDGYPQNAAAATPQVGGSYQPFPGDQERIVPWERPAGGVFNRARAFGFGSPLLVHVERSAWERRGITDALASARDGATVAVRLYEPIVFESYSAGHPGQLARTEHGAVVITCNPGTVLFRRAELA